VEAASGAGNSGDAGALTPLPSAGIAVRGRWWTARAHGGRSFRLPTFSELYLPESETSGGNPDLEPEDAWSGDAGVSVCAGDTRRFGASLEVTAFETLLDEAIVFAPVGGHRFEPVNTGRSWFYGLETAGVLLLPWSSSVRGTWTRTESYREATGEPLPLRPRDRVTGRVASRPAGGPVEIFAEGTWSSGAYADFFGNLAVPDGKVLGGGLTLAPTRGPLDGLAVTAEATNITGADVRDALFFPQPGRAFWLTVRWRGRARPLSQENPR
jgi:outer membrane receptor protein involved in Fe transport